MHWKHLNLSINFTIGFGIVLILLGIVGFRAIFGINGIVVNAGSAEEMATTAEQLSSQAQILQSAIFIFKLGNENYNGSPVPSRPAVTPKAPDAPAPYHQRMDSEDEDFERF